MYKPPFVRSALNYDTNQASDESALLCPEPTLTKQAFRDECDINVIVERFGITGELPQNVRAPQYVDFTEVIDFHTACNAIAQANEAFDAMPAQVRAKFNNDTAAFVDFCSNPENAAEMEKLGLVIEKQETTPQAPPLAKETPQE